MSGLLSFLLRNGSGLLRESAEVFIGQALVRAGTRKLKGILLFYAVLSVFALAALAFFYVLLYRWLALHMDDAPAAGIMCGANLAMIALMLVGRAVIKPRARTLSSSPVLEMIKSRAEGIGASAGTFEAGMAIGSQIGKTIRKSAPKIAVGAAILGLLIGVRPQMFGLFRRRQPKE
jgi:hypothetical protein